MKSKQMSCFVILVAFVMVEIIAGKCNPKTDPHNCIKMGTNYNCDDGKTKLEVDWDPNNPSKLKCNLGSCLDNRNEKMNCLYENKLKIDDPKHHCMQEVITYNESIPASGGHRPVWPVYGEYSYIPRQRYLHSLEHGGIVGLYHPCVADLDVTQLFKSSIKKCLRRYVIGRYINVSPKYPYVLLAYGIRLQMNKVDEDLISSFIKKHALKGREKVSSDGSYNAGLIEKSTMVSDYSDSNLCPSFMGKVDLKQCRNP